MLTGCQGGSDEWTTSSLLLSSAACISRSRRRGFPIGMSAYFAMILKSADWKPWNNVKWWGARLLGHDVVAQVEVLYRLVSQLCSSSVLIAENLAMRRSKYLSKCSCSCSGMRFNSRIPVSLLWAAPCSHNQRGREISGSASIKGVSFFLFSICR